MIDSSRYLSMRRGGKKHITVSRFSSGSAPAVTACSQAWARRRPWNWAPGRSRFFDEVNTLNLGAIVLAGCARGTDQLRSNWQLR
jgi:hypothetical protein